MRPVPTPVAPLPRVGVALFAGVVFLAGCSSPEAPPPNIVVVYADDLDFDELNAYPNDRFPSSTGARDLGLTEGSGQLVFQNDRMLPAGHGRAFDDPRFLTPNLDRLAAEGVVFERFYVTTSICTPSRYSLLTGRYASRSPGFNRQFPPGTHATLQWNTPLDPGEFNVATVLNGAGYRTAAIGKWHNGPREARARDVPPDADPFDPEIAERMAAAYGRGIRFLQDDLGFDVADRIYFNNKEFLGVPDRMKVHNQEWLTEGALEFIDQSHQVPFFLYFALTVPHGQYYEGWEEDDPLATPAGLLEERPIGHPDRADVRRRVAEAGIDPRNAMATLIDDAIGLVMEKLERHGLAENTVLVFASDHQSRGKYTCYESSRAPFIIRWPAQLEPGTFDAVTANIDLLPTFAEIAGARVPEEETIDGRSFLPLLLGQDVPWREGLLLEVSNIKAVVTDRYKYIANRPPPSVVDAMAAEAEESARTGARRQISWDGAKNPHVGEEGIRYGSDRDFPHYFDLDQLYDLENDPFEQVNLAGDEEHAAVVQELQGLLESEVRTLPHTFGEFKTGSARP